MTFSKMAMISGLMMVLLAPINPGLAQDLRNNLPFKPDPARGYDTALKLCTGCHVIDRQQTGTIQPGVPSFIYMANKDQQTPEKLASALIHPFPPMIDTHLTTHEIKDIAAYILTLKSAERGK